ncbi:hypothetical protein DOY81_002481, partial [Sarcophaga bullata]
KMKLKVLITFLVLIAVFAYESFAQRPPNCSDNVAILCGGGNPVQARVGISGQCETYDSQCLVEQLNCLRYNGGEPLLLLC